MDGYKETKKNGHIYLTPTSGQYTHVIIFIHGMGDCPESYLDFFSSELPLPKDTSIKIILPRAQPFPSWFSIMSFPMEDEKCFNFNEAKQSAKKIESIINEEAKNLGGKYENIFIGGFSQGACLSLYLGMTLPNLLGGVICCSGVLFPQTKVSESNKNLRVFVGHGEDDFVIGIKANKLSLEKVKSFPNIEKHYYKRMAHTFNEQEIKDIAAFIAKYMK